MRLAFRETPLQLKSFTSGDFHVYSSLQGPRVLVFFHPSPTSANAAPRAFPVTQHEYINAFSTNSWRETIRSSFVSDSEELDIRDSEENPDPQPSPEPS